MGTWNNLISLLSGLGQAQTTAAGGPTPQPIVPTAPPEANAPTFLSRFGQLQPDIVHPLQALASLYHMAYQHPGRTLQESAGPLGSIFNVTANPWSAFKVGPATNPLMSDITSGNLGATTGDITGGLLNAIRAAFTAYPQLAAGLLHVPPEVPGDLPGEFPEAEIPPRDYPTEPYQPSWNPYGGTNPEHLPGWEPDISKIKIPGFTKAQVQALGEKMANYHGDLEARRWLNRFKNEPARVKTVMQDWGVIPRDADYTPYTSEYLKSKE